MTSALVSLANATVAFTVPGVGVTTDPDTGNVAPVQQTLNVAMFLKMERVEAASYPGVDAGATVYEGYAVDPGQLDAAIVKGSVGQLVFSGQPPVRCVVQELRMDYGTLGVLGAVLSGALGDRIRLVAKEQL